MTLTIDLADPGDVQAGYAILLQHLPQLPQGSLTRAAAMKARTSARRRHAANHSSGCRMRSRWISRLRSSSHPPTLALLPLTLQLLVLQRCLHESTARGNHGSVGALTSRARERRSGSRAGARIRLAGVPARPQEVEAVRGVEPDGLVRVHADGQQGSVRRIDRD
jgi:hypothetical protein